MELKNKILFLTDANNHTKACVNRGFKTTPKNILLRIPGLGVRNVDNILATKTFQTIRLTDFSRAQVHSKKIRPIVVAADYTPPLRQLDSLNFAQTCRPEAHVFPTSVTGEFYARRLSMNTLFGKLLILDLCLLAFQVILEHKLLISKF